MQSTVESLDGNKVKLHVAVPADEFERALDAAFRKLAAEVTDHLLKSPELERAVEQIASSAAVRAALANQTNSLAGELAEGVRRRAERLDDAAERTARRWLRRPLRSSPA